MTIEQDLKNVTRDKHSPTDFKFPKTIQWREDPSTSADPNLSSAHQTPPQHLWDLEFSILSHPFSFPITRTGSIIAGPSARGKCKASCPKGRKERAGKYTKRLPRWLSGKQSTCQCKRLGFDPWVGKIPWWRKRQPTLVFLLGKSH